MVGDKLATICVYIGLARVDSTWSHGIQRQREIHGLGDVMVVDHAALGVAYLRLFRPCQHTGLTKPQRRS